MFFTPAAVLRMWICGLLSLAILGTGGYLLYEWYDEVSRQPAAAVQPGSEPTNGDALTADQAGGITSWRPGLDKETAMLAGALALLGWTFLGRFISPRLLRRRGEDEPKAKRWGEMRRLRREDGTELCIEICGPPDGQPIVLSHGWSIDGTAWYYLKRHLSKRYRVITWDLPGMGRSTRPSNRDFSLEKMARDLRAVIEETCSQPAILVGHSIGGMVTLTFCRMFPEQLNRRISGLVLTNTTYTNPLRTMLAAPLWTALQKPVIEPLLHLTIWLSPLVWLMNLLSYLNGSSHWTTAWEAFAGTETRGQLDFATRFTIKTPPSVFARGCFGMLRYDASSALPGIDVPTLVLVGAGDPVVKPEAGQVLDERLPQSRLFPLAPAKHLTLVERNSQMNEVVEQFVESLRGAPAPAASQAAGAIEPSQDASLPTREA